MFAVFATTIEKKLAHAFVVIATYAIKNRPTVKKGGSRRIGQINIQYQIWKERKTYLAGVSFLHFDKKSNR